MLYGIIVNVIVYMYVEIKLLYMYNIVYLI